MLALCIGVSSPALAQQVRVPGTKVSLAPPAGFVAAERFAGFQNAQNGASIAVTEIPAPASELRASLTPANLQAKGMTHRAAEPVTLGSEKTQLLAVTQTANGTVFEKWMVVTGDASTAVLVVATYPQALAGRLAEPLRAAVLSARWNPATKVDRFEGLPFRVEETDELKVANRMQNMLLIAKPGDPKSRAPGDPVLAVGPAHSPIPISDLEHFAKQRIGQTAQVRDVVDLEGTATTLAGRSAYEITASAKDQTTGAPMTVYQVAILDGNSYYLAVGLVGVAGAARFVPQFKSIVRSLKIGP